METNKAVTKPKPKPVKPKGKVVIKKKQEQPKPKTKKMAVVSIHGFLTGGTPDFEPFTKYLVRNKIEEFEVVDFPMYDPGDKATIKWQKWLEIADEITKEYINNGYEVILMGYSMGSIIATEVMRRNPEIKRLIMLAPSYHIAWFKLPVSQLMVSFKKFRLYIKHRKRLKRAKKAFNHIKPVAIMIQIWKSKKALRKSIRKIENRQVDLIIGKKDSFIKRKKVAKYIKKNLHSSSKLETYWLPEVDHISILHPPTNRKGWNRIIESINEFKDTTM